ncbi:MAG: IclR family transcriptional regulator [Chloroflexota bacterium]|nr:IclR family transcriptional regulator [Chloroflexota bacterium]
MENQSFRKLNDTRITVPAVEKIARIFEVVKCAGGLGVSEIARRADLSKSTAHGLLGALVETGLLSATGDGRGYVLGSWLGDLGAVARDQGILDVAGPELTNLSHETGETVLFGRVSNDRVMVMASRESPHLLYLSVPIGSNLPLFAGALGKARLALEASEPDIPGSLPRYTGRTITDRAAYLREVARTREIGFALDRGEYLPGICAAAAAFSWRGSIYLLWIAGIDSVHDDDELTHMGLAVRAAVDRIIATLETDSRIPARSAS